MKRRNPSAPASGAWILAVLLAVVLTGAPGCGDQQRAVAERAQEEIREGETASLEEEPAREDEGSSAEPRWETRTVTLPSGTTFLSSLQSTIDTGKNKVGDPVRLRTLASVRGVPAGSTIRGQVTHVDPAGRIAGGAELTLRFTELVFPSGRGHAISAVPLRLEGKGEGKKSAIQIGGGAVAGGVLGGVLGGKEDIPKGAAVGAAAGTAVAVLTKGKQIVLPAGQRIRVTLDAPARVSVRTRAS